MADSVRDEPMPVQVVGRIIGDHLSEIAPLFKPGMKLTFLARNPEQPDGSQDMVLTNDDLPAVIAAITIRSEAKA